MFAGKYKKKTLYKNVKYLVICSQIIYLFLEYGCPEIFTDKLHCIQFIFIPRTVFRESEKYKQLGKHLLFAIKTR